MLSHLEKRGVATVDTNENEMSQKKKQMRVTKKITPRKDHKASEEAKEKEKELLTEVVVETEEVLAVELDNGDFLIEMDDLEGNTDQISIYTVNNDGELENVSDMVTEEPLEASGCDAEESEQGREESETAQEATQENSGKLDKKFACGICQRKFARKADCKAHQRVHSDARPYACPHCDKTFTRMGNLNVHQTVHSKERPFVCKVCHKSFSRIHALNRHQEVHSRYNQASLLKIVNKSTLTCPLCQNDFPDFDLFKQHIFAKHVEKGGGEVGDSISPVQSRNN